jgi:hypothetical protein
MADIRKRRAEIQSSAKLPRALWKLLLPAFACCTILAGFWWENAWEATDDMVFQMISPKAALVDNWIF